MEPTLLRLVNRYENDADRFPQRAKPHLENYHTCKMFHQDGVFPNECQNGLRAYAITKYQYNWCH